MQDALEGALKTLQVMEHKSVCILDDR
jgi:hypothetical protein